jgi:hypothetical protein
MSEENIRTPFEHFNLFLWVVSAAALAASYLTTEIVVLSLPAVTITLPHIIIGAYILGLVALVLLKTLRLESFANYLVMFLLFAFLLSHFPANLMLLNTTTTGGDTGSDNYEAKYFVEYLLPAGKLIGWCPGRWLGFPQFQYQFIFPYLMMAALALVIPLDIAFKIVSIFGVMTLPLFTYYAFKYMGSKFPTPIIAATLTLPFLFQEKNTVFGGNIPSMLAGEFQYSISMSFMILFLGFLYYCVEKGKFSLWAPVLYALTALSHACATITAALISLFFLFEARKENLIKNVKVMSSIYILAFFFIAFFLLPLVFKIQYTTDYGGDWATSQMLSWYQYPDAYIFHFLALLGAIWGIFKRDKKAEFLIFAVLMSVIAFYNGEALKTANVRFFPMLYFFVILLAAYALGEFAAMLKGRWMIPIILFLGVTMWISGPIMMGATQLNSPTTFIDSWTKWNYEGFESKAAWNDYNSIMQLVNNTPGRLHNDLSDDNNKFGTPRAFESTPVFSNKWTLEGVYAQATISSPYVSYFQCEMSHHCAGIPRVEGVERTTAFNPDAGTKHAKILNVKDYVAVYDKLKENLSQNPEWKLIGTFGAHQVYNLQTLDGKYVTVPEYEPVLVETKHWRGLSLEWYTNLDNIDVPLAFTAKADSVDEQRFKTKISDDAKAQRILRQSLLKPEFMNDWLICGSFPNPRDAPLNEQNYWDASVDHGLEKAYIDETGVKPVQDGDCGGNKWFSELADSAGYMDLRLRLSQKEEAVAYAHAYVYSPTERDARILYGSDDGIMIWANGKQIVSDHAHRQAIADDKTASVHLISGWNRVLIKVEQVTGGWGFYARLTDAEGKTMNDTAYQSSAPASGEIPQIQTDQDLLQAIKLDNNCTITEVVSNEEIRFNTSCIGKPHIIKISYFPNWKVEGADKIYIVTPAYMLVYPSQKEVRIYYGDTLVDTVGNMMTIVGILFVIVYLAGLVPKGAEKKLRLFK